MSTWDALKGALDEVSARGQSIRVWWRDDDAGRYQPALARLLDLAERRGVTVALAVVPAWLDASTQARIASTSTAVVIQHGLAHTDHAAPGAKAIELGGRPADVVLAELAKGRAILAERFGATFLAVVAPPWNRIDPQVTAQLARAGYRGLSTFGPRPDAVPEGLVQVNTHLDPVAWHEGRGFVGEAAALGQLVGSLTVDEPIGVLSHHLDCDEDGWLFLERLLEVLAAHPGAQISNPIDLFGAAA